MKTTQNNYLVKRKLNMLKTKPSIKPYHIVTWFSDGTWDFFQNKYLDL